jgi:hypothetical protein
MLKKCQAIFEQPLFAILAGLHIAAAFLFVVTVRPTGWLVLPATLLPLQLLAYGRQRLGGTSSQDSKLGRWIDANGWRFWLLAVGYPASVGFGICFGLIARPLPFSDMDVVRYAAAVVTGMILPPGYLLAARSLESMYAPPEN